MRGVNLPGAPNDHRCTPPEVYEPLRRALGIEQWDLDPASNPASTIPAKRALFGRGPARRPPHLCGLAYKWAGHVWLNPPFREIQPWAEKWAETAQANKARSMLAIVPADHSTEWWGVFERSADVLTLWTRVHFPLPGERPNARTGASPSPYHVFAWLRSDAERANYFQRVNELAPSYITGSRSRIFPRGLVSLLR